MNADGSGQRQADAQRGAQLHSCLVPRRKADRLRAPARKTAIRRCSGCGRAWTFEIHVMNADGSGQRKLTQDGAQPHLVARRAKDRVRERTRRQLGHLRHERRRQRQRNLTRAAGQSRKPACLVARAETVSVTAPPRPPRRSDPVDREEIEALVEALIEEARKRAQRRRRRNAAVVTLVALVGAALFAAARAERAAQTASLALAARSSLSAGAVNRRSPTSASLLAAMPVFSGS